MFQDSPISANLKNWACVISARMVGGFAAGVLMKLVVVLVLVLVLLGMMKDSFNITKKDFES